jgi:acetoin utilization deacetylase AcuC-like enzyme
MTIAVLYQEFLKEYDFVFRASLSRDRYALFMKLLQERLQPDSLYKILQAESAGQADLELICDKDYIDFSREYFHALATAGWATTRTCSATIPWITGRSVLPVRLNRLPAWWWTGQEGLRPDTERGIPQGGFGRRGLHHAKQRFGEGFCFIMTWLLPLSI